MVSQNAKRSILITGCSSGIGAYCASALHQAGWRVFATARKDQDIAALKAKGIEAFISIIPNRSRSKRWSTKSCVQRMAGWTRCSTMAPTHSPAPLRIFR